MDLSAFPSFLMLVDETTAAAALPPGAAAAMDVVTAIVIFTLAMFVGFEVITKVPPTLHTPLMSGSNAISGITLVGALISAASGNAWAEWFGLGAIVFAMINVVGGFIVTDRMLAMFKRKE